MIAQSLLQPIVIALGGARPRVAGDTPGGTSARLPAARPVADRPGRLIAGAVKGTEQPAGPRRGLVTDRSDSDWPLTGPTRTGHGPGPVRPGAALSATFERSSVDNTYNIIYICL